MTTTRWRDEVLTPFAEKFLGPSANAGGGGANDDENGNDDDEEATRNLTRAKITRAVATGKAALAADNKARSLKAFLHHRFSPATVEAFTDWSLGVLTAFSDMLRLGDDDWSPEPGTREHRALLLGLRTAKVLANNDDENENVGDGLVRMGLSPMAGLDPVEAQAFRGFRGVPTDADDDDDNDDDDDDAGGGGGGAESGDDDNDDDDDDDDQDAVDDDDDDAPPRRRVLRRTSSKSRKSTKNHDSSKKTYQGRRTRFGDDPTPPASFDMRAKGGLLNPIKDQGACGSCWSFAATVALETAIRNQGGPLFSLSEQQVLDCNPFYSPCGGGDATAAWKFVGNSAPSGQTTTSVYPYWQLTHCNWLGRCQTQKCRTMLNARGVATIESERSASIYTQLRTEADVQSVVMNQGAVVMTLDAACLDTYDSGILTPSNCQCSSTRLDHQVAIVGWGSSNGVDYWIARNQWGVRWGENGNFRIARDASLFKGKGLCGIYAWLLAPRGSFAVVADTQQPRDAPATSPPTTPARRPTRRPTRRFG